MLALIQRIRKKCFGNLFIKTKTMDNGNFTNSECSCFFKRRTSLHKVIWLWPSGQGGTCYIFAQIQRKIKKKFFLLINLLTVIQWVNIACICFLKGKQPYTSFF